MQELLIALAGPAVNLVLAILLGVLLTIFTDRGIFPQGDPTRIFKSEYLHPGVLGNSAYLLSDDIHGKEFLLFKRDRWRLWRGTARALAITVQYWLRRKSINRKWLARIDHYQTKQSWEAIFFGDNAQLSQ